MTAPVTDSETNVPPSRLEIEAEVAIADGRRVRGDRENRADAAATILRWLIGDDDHVPVRGENRGELVGGLGDIVRSRQQMAEMLALAAEVKRRAMIEGRDMDADPADRQFAGHNLDYLNGVGATLAWGLGERAEAPITRVQSRELTSRDLKSERVHAEDVVQQGRSRWTACRLPPRWYGEGVKSTITWLVGDSTAAPVDPAGGGPSGT